MVSTEGSASSLLGWPETPVSDTGTTDLISSGWRPVTPSCDLLVSVVAVLKEADSVSQPADRVRTLWKKDERGGGDPEPLHIPRRPLAVRSSSSSFMCRFCWAVTPTFSPADKENRTQQLRPRQSVPPPRRRGEPDPHAIFDQLPILSDSQTLSCRRRQRVSSPNRASPNPEGRETGSQRPEPEPRPVQQVALLFLCSRLSCFHLVESDCC